MTGREAFSETIGTSDKNNRRRKRVVNRIMNSKCHSNNSKTGINRELRGIRIPKDWNSKNGLWSKDWKSFFRTLHINLRSTTWRRLL
jgi:hypothetical protein